MSAGKALAKTTMLRILNYPISLADSQRVEEECGNQLEPVAVFNFANVRRKQLSESILHLLIHLFSCGGCVEISADGESSLPRAFDR